MQYNNQGQGIIGRAHRILKQQLLKNKKGEQQAIFLQFTYLLLIFKICPKVVYVKELNNTF